MSTFSFQIDPHTVLGVAPEATLWEIREAYHQKAKRFHPDAGGEAWTFHVLVRSYELLSSARVARASQRESSARPVPEDDRRGGPRIDRSNAETVWPTVSDQPRDPARVVDVERLWVHYEVDHLWLLREDPNDQRSLSCCLSLAWPSSILTDRAAITDAEGILGQLREVFDATCVQTRVINARLLAEEGQFSGWLSYPHTKRAAAALAKLRELLGQRGFGIRAWNRDLIIPAEWR